jgi:hypothetical protein
MSRHPQELADVETLVRRTLTEVADALPVADAPPATGDVASLAPAGRSGRTRLAVLAAAAAVVVLGVGVWAVQRTGDEESVGVTSPGPPEAGYLPDGVSREGVTVWSGGIRDVEARIATGPGPNDVLVALEGPDLERVDQAAQTVAAHVGAPARDAGARREVTYGLGPAGRVRAYVARSGAEVAAAALEAAASVDDTLDAGLAGGSGGVRGRWRTTGLDLSWLPGVGRGVGTGYWAADAGGTGPPSVAVTALAADLPEAPVARSLLDGESALDVGDGAAWGLATPNGATVILQAAPGVVGVVTGTDVTLGEMVRVAGDVRWPTAVAEPPGERCGEPPDAALRATGEVGLVGATDRPYDVASWAGRGTPGEPVTCTELTIGGARYGLRHVGSGSEGAVGVARVAATDEEVVLFAVHGDGVIFVAPGGSTQPVDASGPHGTVFTFVHLDREGAGEAVPLTLYEGDGSEVMTLWVGLGSGGSAGNDTN